MAEVVDKPTAFRKELWQSSPDGRDFCEILPDKNSINLQIKRLLNLEQCTENHDNEVMNRRFVVDNCSQNDTEFEETEYKLLLDNRARSECIKEITVSESCEKSDPEKEFKEENESKDERKDENRYEEMKNSDDGSHSTVSESCDIDKSANETTCNGQQEEDMEKSETECFEKNGKGKGNEELDEISDDFIFGQNVGCSSPEGDADNADENRMDDSRKKCVKLMVDDGKSEIESRAGQLDEVITESGFCEDFESLSVKNADNTEVAEMKEIDQVQKCFVVLDSCNAKPSEELILIKRGENVSKVDCFSVIEAEPNELTSSSESDRCEAENSNRDEKNDWLGSGTYSREDLIAMTTEFQQLTFPFVNCTDAGWYERQEKKWNNISSFTVMDKGPEIKSCVFCHGGSGCNGGDSPNGSGEDSGSAGDKQAVCLSLSGCSSSCAGGGCAGSGGSGGDDGDKWKKESFCHSDANDDDDERKTKQAKEMKKKSRLEKGDLTGSNDSNGDVSYGSTEDLSELATEWEEKAENLRQNAVQNFSQSIATKGIILSPFQAQYLITGKGFNEDQEWFRVTDENLGLEEGCCASAGNLWSPKSGSNGKCYPCIDINTGSAFCIKQIDLFNFYANEITVLMDLNHPGVVKLHGAIFTKGNVLIMMELITGPTLQEHIMKFKPRLDCYTALKYTKQLLEVLSYLHGEGVHHRDIKEDNIMLREGSVVLIDFGLAKRNSIIQNGTKPFGNQCGTSLERTFSKARDSSDDVWDAITILFRMLSGSMPCYFTEQSSNLEDLPSDVPPEVRSLIESRWTIDEKNQSLALILLSHEAFQLLSFNAFRHHTYVVYIPTIIGWLVPITCHPDAIDLENSILDFMFQAECQICFDSKSNVYIADNTPTEECIQYKENEIDHECTDVYPTEEYLNEGEMLIEMFESMIAGRSTTN